MSSSQLLDFENILSKNYRSARVSQVISNETYDPSRSVPRRRKKYTTSNGAGSTSGSDQVDGLGRQRELSRLVSQLVTYTPTFQELVQPGGAMNHRKADFVQHLQLQPLYQKNSNAHIDIPSKFHPVEIDDWESKIHWDVLGNPDNDPRSGAHVCSAAELLQKKRNAWLDNLNFEDIDLEHGFEILKKRAEEAPLVLELGIAGQSVAKQVYLSTSMDRPLPAIKSEAYQKRMEKTWAAQPVTSTAELSKGTLHKDKDKLEAFKEARQRKREEMEKEKTLRVSEAMGTVSILAGGRGRTIKSSLMGPGGTERTGRPSKQVGSASIDAEYVEQLDMILNHTLVKDVSNVMLRQYHRPKLPKRIVRPDLSWQFQIRHFGSSMNAETSSGTDAYQSLLMGSTAGRISKAKLRAENDLSPTEGNLIVLEYSEERPTLQMTKGMAGKIVNYYRGDRSQCPVSAGGGDRPTRRKRQGESGKETSTRLDKLPPLTGLGKATSIIDWIGKVPKKRKEAQEDIDILPEGVTEVLHPKVHGPFLGEVENGTTQSGFVSNLFVAPIFYHEREDTDFLMILTPPSGAAKIGQRESMGVIIRDMPNSTFAVGQVEPRTRVHAPQSQSEKTFLNPFIEYQLAKLLTRSQARDGQGLRFDELQARMLPSLGLSATVLRQRLKQVAVYDKNSTIWSSKAIGFEEYPGVDALARAVAPEGIAAFETACAAARRLSDLGILQIYRDFTAPTVGVALLYLTGELNSRKAVNRNLKKFLEKSRSAKGISPLQLALYEAASEESERSLKIIRQVHEVARFIYEEIQLSPWHISGEFIDVHKNAQGTGMMKLVGLGDPSGTGEAFSFLREADSKPTKSGVGAAATQKKITGTENDLRKLSMKEMEAILLSYKMPKEKVDSLKRWDRVHIIREFSTKAASDGIGDGLERYARDEKMKLAEQKKMYRDRIQVIWKRQASALSVDPASIVGPPPSGKDGDGKEKSAPGEAEESDEDSEDEGDDFAEALEEEMMEQGNANRLLTEGNDFSGDRSKLHNAARDEKVAKDAQDYAALRRQREEEKAAQESLSSRLVGHGGIYTGPHKKVIRRRIVKTHPDGRQTISFQYVIQPDEVGKIMARLKQQEEPRKLREISVKPRPDEKTPGHSFFEDDDDFEFVSNSKKASLKGGRGRGRTTPKPRATQIAKTKGKASGKRKRDDDDLEAYTVTKRKGTNDRRARGSIRERRPHIIFSQKLEKIRASVEERPGSAPFHKPVSRRLIPHYYEIISDPIDLGTIREKIGKYEYRSASAFVRDFELMKMNAIKFNGEGSPIAQEATAIHTLVKNMVDTNREELAKLEDSVDELMSGASKKAKKQKRSGNTTTVGGVSVNLGDLPKGLAFGDSDSGEEDGTFTIDF